MKTERGGKPWYFIMVLIFTYVVVITFCLFIRATTWPNNKHIDAFFFLPALALPFLIITALMCFVNIFKAHLFIMLKCVSLSRYHRNTIKTICPENIIIAGWSVITPLEQPALNLLKLEGEFPLPRKIR